MAKYRVQSANVLNEADRFGKILDWQLFCMEQETQLWGYSNEAWLPGKPMYTHPNILNEHESEEIYGNIPMDKLYLNPATYDKLKKRAENATDQYDLKWFESTFTKLKPIGGNHDKQCSTYCTAEHDFG